jgi:hypothetical protein
MGVGLFRFVDGRLNTIQNDRFRVELLISVVFIKASEAQILFDFCGGSPARRPNSAISGVCPLRQPTGCCCKTTTRISHEAWTDG